MLQTRGECRFREVASCVGLGKLLPVQVEDAMLHSVPLSQTLLQLSSQCFDLSKRHTWLFCRKTTVTISTLLWRLHPHFSAVKAGQFTPLFPSGASALFHIYSISAHLDTLVFFFLLNFPCKIGSFNKFRYARGPKRFMKNNVRALLQSK